MVPENSPSSLMCRQIATFDIVFDFVDWVAWLTWNVEERVIGALVQVFVKVGKDRDCKDDVNEDVAVKLIDEFGDVRDNPTIFFCGALVMHAAV